MIENLVRGPTVTSHGIPRRPHPWVAQQTSYCDIYEPMTSHTYQI